MKTLELLVESVGAADIACDRIALAISNVDTTVTARKAEIVDLEKRAAAANISALLDGGSSAVLADLAEQRRIAIDASALADNTRTALSARLTEAREAATEARRNVAAYVEGMAWPVWHNITNEAIQAFDRFLALHSQRMVLAATVTDLYRRSGVIREIFRETELPTFRFENTGTLGDLGLAELAPKHFLTLRSEAPAFKLSGSAPLLTTAELVEMSKQAEQVPA